VNRETELAAAAQLEQISRYHMPFGMFGPKQYPPKGVPIYDLPAEYLAWFALKAFLRVVGRAVAHRLPDEGRRVRRCL
jgi:uncharacterized protein (DUF3820 family)